MIDPRDIEQVSLSWHLIQEGNPSYKDALAHILDEKVSEIMPKTMNKKCQDISISAHSKAVIGQLDFMVHCLGSRDQTVWNDSFAEAGARHANHGIQSKHYVLFGEAILRTLEHFLGSGSGQQYWKRVEKSWNALFRVMFETMKTESKNEEKRQELALKACKRSNAKHSALNKETLNEDSVTDFSSSSSSEHGFLSVTRISSEEDMACSSHKESKKATSMRNLFASSGSTPDRPSRKHPMNDAGKKATSMRNLFTSSVLSPQPCEKGARFGGLGQSKSTRLLGIGKRQPDLHSADENVVPASPASVGRPGLGRSKSGLPYAMEGSHSIPGTPRSRRDNAVLMCHLEDDGHISSPRSVERPCMSRSKSGRVRRDIEVFSPGMVTSNSRSVNNGAPCPPLSSPPTPRRPPMPSKSCSERLISPRGMMRKTGMMKCITESQ